MLGNIDVKRRAGEERRAESADELNRKQQSNLTRRNG
jgi:hypothetical protein